MPSDSSVIADPAIGAAIVAGTRVVMSAAANGALRFGGADGRVLRPLTFGERTELVSAASALPAARDAVAAGILAAATLERGAGATPLMEVLAMWLAGAAFDAPDFMETTLLVARAAGWAPHELLTAPAREVDRLAVHLDEQRRASEWKSLVFAEAPAETIEAVRARFADRLLRRSNAAVERRSDEEEPALETPPAVTSETRLLSGRTVSEAERTPPPFRDPEKTLPRESTSPREPIPAGRLPLLRGVRLVVPRDERESAIHGGAAGFSPPASASVERRPLRPPVVGGPKPAAPQGSGVAMAVSGQRPALAFAIRQPRVDATREATESVETFRRAAAALPLSTAAALLPHSEPEPEPQHEAHFPERVPSAAPRTGAPRVIAPHSDDVAATLAALLDDEADLRGVDR